MEDYEKIIAKCKKAIAKDKDNLEAYSNWQKAIKSLEEPDQALQEYRDTIQKNLDTPDAYKECGNLLLSLEKYEDAIEEYQKSIKKDDKYIKAYNNWGVALNYLDKGKEAIEKFEKAIKIDNKYKDAYYNLGNTLDRLERYDEAIEQYKRANEIDDKDIDVYNNWGCTLLNLERYKEAIEQYKTAIEKADRDIMKEDSVIIIYANWGRALISLKRYKEAIDIFNIIINEIDDKNVIALMGCAYALESSGRHKEAFNQYNKASEYAKNDPYPIHCIAALKDKQGLYKVAYKKWEEACEIYEQNIEDKKKEGGSNYFLNYGSIYQYTTLKDLSKAEEQYNQGLAINPGNTQILINLISLTLAKSKDDCVKSHEKENEECNKTEEYCKAREYFHRAEKILKEGLDKRESISTHIALGELHMAMNETQKAEEYFKNALSIDNECINCKIYLGAIYMQDENYEKAIHYFKDATKLEPDNLDLRSNLAEAYLIKGLTEKAEREYREILDITNNHMDSLIGIAHTYITMGENAKERKDLASAEIMFKEAERYQEKIIELMAKKENASEILNEKEKSDFYYSKGYNKVMLYETEKIKKSQLLREARTDFEKVKKNTLCFYKAKRAITKIDERLYPTNGIVDKWGPRIVLSFSFIILVLIQLYFFAGQFVFKSPPYKPLESGYYALMTFGCLLFMIAGLCLSQITKLKVGALELEKSTIDQNPTPFLGIDKNSFNKLIQPHDHKPKLEN